jgi:hypothetical protein
MPRLIELTTRTGEPYTVGTTVVTPQSQALIIRLPFFGFVWNRPRAGGWPGRIATCQFTGMSWVSARLFTPW